MTDLPARRPAFLLASLGAATPSVVFADTMPPAGGPTVGTAPSGYHSLPSGSILLAIVAVLLLGVAALVLTGRMTWRLGAIAIVGGCALFGGDAMLDGAWTAIAVSP